MAKTQQQKDILSRVQDLVSEALDKLAEMPGGSKLTNMANETRTRLDDMQKKLRGLDTLEKRVEKLERELARKSAASKPTTARKPAARRSATVKKPPA
jgi:polyhydroxyalkanoate synthesis regulator phasin